MVLLVIGNKKILVEVWSEPMVFSMYMEFLKKYPAIKLVEDKDTAEQ
jgi:prephenate dehydratase